MRSGIGVLLAILSITASGIASPASLGGGFADLYSSFAPLYGLYRSYADYLFRGSSVAVPQGIVSSCDGLTAALYRTSLDSLLKTPSEALSSLASLRLDAAEFCLSYRSTLGEIERASPDGLIPLLDRASDEGLFASINRLNRMLEETLSQVLAALGGDLERWRFGVVFAVRTIIDRDSIDRIDEDLRGIFYGEGGSPPVELPEEVSAAVSAAMAGLISLSGRPLSGGEADQARYLAECIECYFVFNE